MIWDIALYFKNRPSKLELNPPTKKEILKQLEKTIQLWEPGLEYSKFQSLQSTLMLLHKELEKEELGVRIRLDTENKYTLYQALGAYKEIENLFKEYEESSLEIKQILHYHSLTLTFLKQLLILQTRN